MRIEKPPQVIFSGNIARRHKNPMDIDKSEENHFSDVPNMVEAAPAREEFRIDILA